MSDNKDAGVTVGGAYVENPDFVPNPSDMYGTFNTHGVGAHHDPATVSPIFEVDRNLTAREVLNALDPDSPVSSDRVLLPEAKAVVAADDEGAKETLKALAEKRLEKEVVIGGPSEAEKEAALSGDEGTKAAEAQEAENASNDGAVTGVTHESAPAVAQAPAPVEQPAPVVQPAPAVQQAPTV